MPGSRAARAGDMYAIEKKMEQRYDEEVKLGTPSRIVRWINNMMEGEVVPCRGTEYNDIHLYLKDGVILGKIMNKLFEGTDRTCSYKKTNTTFVAMENIENFNKAAAKYGVPEEALFQTVDLTEGRKGPMLNVINCLNRLGFTANSNGFEPQYEAIEPPVNRE